MPSKSNCSNVGQTHSFACAVAAMNISQLSMSVTGHHSSTRAVLNKLHIAAPAASVQVPRQAPTAPPDPERRPGAILKRKSLRFACITPSLHSVPTNLPRLDLPRAHVPSQSPRPVSPSNVECRVQCVVPPRCSCEVSCPADGDGDLKVRSSICNIASEEPTRSSTYQREMTPRKLPYPGPASHRPANAKRQRTDQLVRHTHKHGTLT